MITVLLFLISIGTFSTLYPSQATPDENIAFSIPKALQIIALSKSSPNPSPENQPAQQPKHRRSSSSAGKIQTQGVSGSQPVEQANNQRRMSN